MYVQLADTQHKQNVKVQVTYQSATWFAMAKPAKLCTFGMFCTAESVHVAPVPKPALHERFKSFKFQGLLHEIENLGASFALQEFAFEVAPLVQA